MACGCGGCGKCDCCTKPSALYVANPGFISCGESFQLEVFDARGAVRWTLVSAPDGIALSPSGLLTIPLSKTGYIKVRVDDSENYTYSLKIAIYCPVPDPRLGAGNCCDILIRLQGCFPITITDAKGRTKTVNSDKDFQFIVL